MAQIEHFEIPADDIARARDFYAKVFGFTYEPWGDDMGMLMTGSEQGINGDLHKRGTIVTHPTVVITVDNIEETLAVLLASGGQQLGDIQPLDESSRWVYVRDSEGNAIGLYDKRS